MAYGDGEAPASAMAHVATCSTCTAQVSSYAHIQVELRRTLFRFDCPDAHTLGEYQLDLLEPEHDGYRGIATFRGRPFGSFRMTRARGEERS